MKVRIDKIYHAVASYTAVLTLALFMPLAYAVVATLVVGALKEWYDHEHPPHQAEWSDFWADVVGAVLAAALVWGVAL